MPGSIHRTGSYLVFYQLGYLPLLQTNRAKTKHYGFSIFMFFDVLVSVHYKETGPSWKGIETWLTYFFTWLHKLQDKV